MKAVRALVLLAIIVAALGISSGSVAAEAYASYVSGITMVNLSSSSASVVVTYYRGGTGADAGVVADTIPDTIAGNGVKDYAAIPVSNFRGAIVISSTQPLAAISTLTGGGLARGSYVGVQSGATSVLLPFLAKNHGSGQWNTFMAVQNTGSVDTTVTVDYASCAGTDNGSALVKPGSSVIFDQKTTACLANGITSAVVTSSGEPIAAVVSQESTIKNTALVSNGFGAASASLVIPLVNANNPNTSGWRTAITIMNNGAVPTTLKLTYKRTDGSTCTETQTIPSKASKVYAGASLTSSPPPAGVTTTCVAGAKLIGAAYVAVPADNSAGVPIVAIVNQDRGSLGSAYTSSDPTTATPRISMPLIMDNNGAGQWGTSFNIMNVGTATTYVKCVFSGATTYVATSGPSGLAANGVFEDLQRGKLGGPKISSATCTAYTSTAYTTIDTAAKIVGVVNERGLVGNGDLMLSYEAFNSIP